MCKNVALEAGPLAGLQKLVSQKLGFTKKLLYVITPTTIWQNTQWQGMWLRCRFEEFYQ